MSNRIIPAAEISRDIAEVLGVSDNVVSLDSYRPNPHLSGPAKCMACGYEWVAVAPVGTHRLECSQCHTMRGTWRYPCTGGEGEPFWTCNCGSDLFVLTSKSLICTACGERKTGWYIDQDPDHYPGPPPKKSA